MDDSEFTDELEEYLSGVSPNWVMVVVEIVWVDGNPGYGSLHIDQHGMSKSEVEEALFEIPPNVEAKRHPQHPGRTIFWGATRNGRWLFIVCEDWTVGRTRYLRPITAFTPEDGRAYWDQL